MACSAAAAGRTPFFILYVCVRGVLMVLCLVGVVVVLVSDVDSTTDFVPWEVPQRRYDGSVLNRTFTLVKKNLTEWDQMTTADFAQYRAVVVPDIDEQHCLKKGQIYNRLAKSGTCAPHAFFFACAALRAGECRCVYVRVCVCVWCERAGGREARGSPHTTSIICG